MRIALALVAPALLLVLGGCFQAETIVKVKADGSGTIEETSSMSLEAIKMFKGQMDEMAKNMGGGAAGGQKEMFSAEQAKAKAANMGEGVEFVSCEPIKTPTHEGQKAVYRFADITKLKLDTQPAPQGGPAGGAAGGPAAGKQGGGDVITFKFAKQPGGNALVTAVFAEKKTPKQEEKKADDAAQEMQLAMMKQFMKGLKFSIAVVPDGTLVKTNSSYRDGSKVTLMEMDLDEVMKDEAAFKKLGATQNMSMPEASKALSGVAGIKIPSSSEVTIEFTGK